MTGGNQRMDAVRRRADAVLVVLDFTRNADLHGQAVLMALTQEATSAGPA